MLIDYADKAKSSSFAISRQVLHILQTHYPERLGAALIAHVPWLVLTFYKLIAPFIDPVTREKMMFNPVNDENGLWRSEQARIKGSASTQENLDGKVFELDQLVCDGWKGSQNFTYEHDIYWPALVEMCDTRRKHMTKAWLELGGTIGIKEWDVKLAVQNMTDAMEKIPTEDEKAASDVSGGEAQELVEGTKDI